MIYPETKVKMPKMKKVGNLDNSTKPVLHTAQDK